MTTKDDAKKPAPMPLTSRFPTDGRQPAFKSYTSTSLNAVSRQTPEMFGGVSTE